MRRRWEGKERRKEAEGRGSLPQGSSAIR